MDLPDFVWPSAPSIGVFLTIVLGILVAWPLAVAWAAQRSGQPERAAPRGAAVGVLWLAVVVVTWVFTTSELARSAGPPPPMMVFLGASIGGSLALAMSRVGRWLTALPMWALLAFQWMRLPLEVVLHVWAGSGTVPATMTWSGQNWDVVAGIACAAAALWLAARAPSSRGGQLTGIDSGVAWAATGLGIVLLANVIRVAVGSTPGPLFVLDADPPLMLALHPPLSLIVPVCVGSAAAVHGVAVRALCSDPNPTDAP